ncbi:MAG: right-handed parallel beta-helix repeat-containing protein [Thermoplasmata archaeon]|nr:right-handed parallel beta-helix repeat-containing protein [Thermoplasmata archaeon]
MRPRRVFTMFTLLILILLPIVQHVSSVPPVYSKTLIVDINGSGDYTSIKAAVENATSMDTIRVKSGVYIESNLTIDKKLILLGDNSETTIINFKGREGILIDSSYVEIRNLKLVNAYDYTIKVSSESIRCKIYSSYIDVPINGVGIYIQASYTIVSDCIIANDHSSGIGVKIQGLDNVISNCNIYGCSVGILALLSSRNNRIVNCNVFNNEVGIDLRINSNNNLISDCNIYGNYRGIYIWQNSNNNTIYHNNFFKNDIDAVDENKNKWDSGMEGNYWDDYEGIDSNEDGIGDTPHIISEENRDNYPLMSRIIPDKPTQPTNIQILSNITDNTPTFTWNPSYHHSGIKTYYIKVDNLMETSIGNVTIWTSTIPLSDGYHTLYLRAESNDNKMSDYVTYTFTIDTSSLDSDKDEWTDNEEKKYGTDPYDPYSYPTDNDNDHLPDYIDIDDDNDGLLDSQEEFLGTDPKQNNEIEPISTDKGTMYLIDIDNDSIYDIFYDPENNIKTDTKMEKNGYLLDMDNDDKIDHLYNLENKKLVLYNGEQKELNLILWILAAMIIIATAVAIIFFIKKRKMFTMKKDEGQEIEQRLEEFIPLEFYMKKEEGQKIEKPILEDKRFEPHETSLIHTTERKVIEDMNIEPLSRFKEKEYHPRKDDTETYESVEEIEKKVDEMFK